MIIVILLSAIVLAMSGPLVDPSSDFNKKLEIIDMVTTFIFVLECFLKILTFGMIFNGKWSYFRRPWFILDFIIVIFSILSLTSLSDDLKAIKVLRILRFLDSRGLEM